MGVRLAVLSIACEKRVQKCASKYGSRGPPNCGIYRRNCHYEFNMVFRKSCIVFCAKPKEVNPIKLKLIMKNKCLDSTQKYH